MQKWEQLLGKIPQLLIKKNNKSSQHIQKGIVNVGKCIEKKQDS